MRIVIFGLARSGTTALFFKIKNSYSSDLACLFEPQAFDPRTFERKGVRAFLSRKPEPDVLAKVLPFRPGAPANVDSFSNFEKQILIVRDARDRLISRLLYGVHGSNFCTTDHKVRSFVELVEQKEADPKSVPVKYLIKTFAELNGERFSFESWSENYRHHSIRRPLDFHDARKNLFLFRYEEMIDKRFEILEEYLGLPLRGEASVADSVSRVTRTRDYGDWRNWFTTEDVEFFRPLLQPYLDRYYSGADWELNESPEILSDHGSRYVAKLVSERRAFMRLPAFTYEQ